MLWPASIVIIITFQGKSFSKTVYGFILASDDKVVSLLVMTMFDKHERAWTCCTSWKHTPSWFYSLLDLLRFLGLLRIQDLLWFLDLLRFLSSLRFLGDCALWISLSCFSLDVLLLFGIILLDLLFSLEQTSSLDKETYLNVGHLLCFVEFCFASWGLAHWLSFCCYPSTCCTFWTSLLSGKKLFSPGILSKKIRFYFTNVIK